MRALPLVLVPLLAQPALAADREGLFGTWRLASFLIEDAGAETGWRPIYGEHPKGYLVLTPDGHLISVVTGEGRTAPRIDEDRAAAFRPCSPMPGGTAWRATGWPPP